MSQPQAAPLLDAAAVTPKLTVHGYVEAFYQLNFNWPSNLTTAYRGFDDRSSSFTISNAVLDVTGTLGPAFARVALQIGSTPASYYQAEPSYSAVAGTGASNADLWRYIQQAIAGYQIPVGRGLLAEAGIFLSPIGLENIPIATQWSWSRSNLFFALPYYHAGVRLTYPLTDRWSATLYVVNGWNDVVNKNDYPCLAGVANYAAGESLSIQLLYFGGVEQAANAPEGQPWRNLFDGTATWNPTPWLTLAAQADGGFEMNNFGTSSWLAGAAYLRVQAHSKLFFTVRIDHFHESDAANSAGAAPRLFFPANEVGSETVTADFKPTGNYSLRLEYRHDAASEGIYFRGNVPQLDGMDLPNAKIQNTLTLGAVAAF